MSRIARLARLAGSDKVAALAASAVRSATRVALGVAAARTGDTELFARFVLLMSVETIACTLINAAITMPLITLASGAHAHEATRLQWAARRGCRLLSAVGVPVAAAAAWAMTHASPGVLVAYTVFLASSMLTSPRQGELTAFFRSRRILAGEVALVAGTVATLGVSLILEHGPEIALWLSLAAGALLRGVVLGRDSSGTHPDPDPKAADRLRAVAVPMVIGSIGVTVSSRIQPFVLQALLGAAQVSVFGACQTMVGPIRLLSASISGMLRPRLAAHARRGDPRAFKLELRQALAPVAAIGVLLCSVAIMLGDSLVRMVFGVPLADAGACLAALSIYATLEAFGAVLAVAVQSLSEDGSRVVTRRRLASVVLGVTVLIPAALWGGAVGSALSLALTEGVFVLSMLMSLPAAPQNLRGSARRMLASLARACEQRRRGSTAPADQA